VLSVYCLGVNVYYHRVTTQLQLINIIIIIIIHVPIVMKSGSLSLLEPSVPVQACNGIDLAFTYTLIMREIWSCSDCKH
jgi:hypothetical protein